MVSWTMSAHKFDQLYCHPVVATVYEKLEKPWGEGQEVVGSPPTKLTDDIDDGGRDTWVLILCHKTFLDLWPCCPQSFWVYQS